MIFWQLLPIGAFVGVVILMMPVFVLFPGVEKGWPGLLVVIPGLALATAAMIATARYANAQGMLAQMREDTEELPHGDDEQYVGVAYSDGDWGYRGDTSWDRGWLSIRSGLLRFRGFGPPFALPLTSIDGIRVHETRGAMSKSAARVYFDWHDDQGERNTLSLEIRDCTNKTRARESAEDLAKHLETMRRQADLAMAPTEWPFRSSGLTFSHLGAAGVTAKDRAIALVASTGVAALAIALTTLIGHFVHQSLGGAAGGFAPAAILVYRAVILKRIEKRKMALL